MIPENLRRMRYVPVVSSPLNRHCADPGLLGDIVKNWDMVTDRQIPSSLRMVAAPTDPASPGDVYRDEGTGEVYVWNGTSWTHLGAQPTPVPNQAIRLSTAEFIKKLSYQKDLYATMQPGSYHQTQPAMDYPEFTDRAVNDLQAYLRASIAHSAQYRRYL